MNIISVPIIVVIVYALIELFKLGIKHNKKILNFIPLIAGTLGGVLGIITFYMSPFLIPTSYVLDSFLIGLISGLTATGSNQILKQLQKYAKTKILLNVDLKNSPLITDEKPLTKTKSKQNKINKLLDKEMLDSDNANEIITKSTNSKTDKQ